ncbi:PP2C family protein-serine/threonine phosphatase [Streptomyces cavourensis]
MSEGTCTRRCPPPTGVRLVIADVQGKGLGTIRCAAVVLAAFREAGPEYQDLTEVGRRIESALKRSTDGQRFVTGILAQISPDGQLLAFNQGHPAPLLRTADGDIRFIEPDEPVPPFGLTGLAGSAIRSASALSGAVAPCPATTSKVATTSTGALPSPRAAKAPLDAHIRSGPTPGLHPHDPK